MADISPNTSWTVSNPNPIGSWTTAEAGPSTSYATQQIIIWGSSRKGFMELFWEVVPSNWGS